MAGDFIKFLGTAGARFVMARQARYSAGTLVCIGGQRVMMDPGPGTLLRCAKSRPRIDPAELDAVLLTHVHLDHSGDLNAILDAMTAGGFRPGGVLFAPAECLDGPDAVVLRYLKEHIGRIETLRAETDYELDGLRFRTSVGHDHRAETYGIKFRRRGDRTVAFMVDSLYFDGLAEAYEGADVLIINVVRREPHPTGWVKHLSLEDARRIIAHVRPRKAVLTHYGMTMLKARPRTQAARLSDELGLEVIAASDGMTLDLD